MRVAQAIDVLLRFQSDALPEPYATFWPLFVEARLRPDSSPFGRRRSSDPVSARRVPDMVAAVQPRLTVSRKLSFREPEAPRGPTTNIKDMRQAERRVGEGSVRTSRFRWAETSHKNKHNR